MHSMLHRVLLRWFQLLRNYPKTMIGIVLFSVLLWMSPLIGVSLNLSFMALLDKEDPLIERYIERSESLKINQQLLVLLKGEDEKELDTITENLLEELPKHPDIAHTLSSIPHKWIEENIGWLTSDHELALLMDLFDHPFDHNRHKKFSQAYTQRLEINNTQLKGARLMIIVLTSDPLNIDLQDTIAGKSPFNKVEAYTQDLLKDSSVTAEFAGLAAMGAQDQQKTLSAISKLTPLSLILVLLILLLVEREWKRLVSLAIPMVLALGCALGCTAWLLGSLTFTEGFFGMMVFGLGIDFGLHLLVRLREEREKEPHFETALQRTIIGCGPAIIAGAITTAGAFAIIGFAPDPMARHLGVSGALGLFFCLIFMLSILPAVWILMEKEQQPHNVIAFRVPLIDNLSLHASTYPKAWIGGAIIVAIFALMGTPRFHYEQNLDRIFNRDVPAVHTSKEIQSRFKTNSTPWIFCTHSIEEAQDLHTRLKEHGYFTHIFGTATLFPVPLDTRHDQLKTLAHTLPKKQKRLRIQSVGPPHLSLPAQRMLTLSNHLMASAKQGPPLPQTFPTYIKSQIIDNHGCWYTFAYGPQASLNAETLKKERLIAESLHPSAAGMGNFIEAAMNLNRPWIPQIIIAVIGFVLCVLIIDIRKPIWIFIAITPVIFGTLLTFGLMCWLNIGFSVLLITVLPLLLGLGVDDGLHVVHRMFESPDLPAHQACQSVIRAITMTTLTTCISFGVLLFSNHPGMESMAWTLLFGLPVCLLTSATLVPALSIVFKLRRAPDHDQEPHNT